MNRSDHGDPCDGRFDHEPTGRCPIACPRCGKVLPYSWDPATGHGTVFKSHVCEVIHPVEQ